MYEIIEQSGLMEKSAIRSFCSYELFEYDVNRTEPNLEIEEFAEIEMRPAIQPNL